MPTYTKTLGLKKTNMNTDGDDLFDFGDDLDNNWDKLDSAITTLINKQSSAGIPPSICTALRKKENEKKVYLQWKDPDDTIIDGQVLCSWQKTIVVGKSGGVPETESDGDIIIESTTRNAYNTTALEIDLTDYEGEYNFRLFPVSMNGVVCYDKQNKFGAIKYEFLIDPNNSDPASRVKYLGENADFEPAYMDFTADKFHEGDWGKAFFMALFKPCMQNPDGSVKYYLCEDDYSLQADGVTPSEVADTTQDANAMVEIGQIWIKEEELTGGIIHVSISNENYDGSYDCHTHRLKDGSYADYVYRAIYDGCNILNKIRSLSGQAICKTTAGDKQIEYAKANGDGWNVDEWSMRRLINYLLILIGKSTDVQSVFGAGRYSGGSASSNNQLNTGTLDKKGKFYGGNANGAVKVFHIENWWGNIWKITNGCIQKSGELLYKMCEGTWDGSTVEEYNTTGEGYVSSGVTNTGKVTEQYTKTMKLVPGIGLVPKNESGGSSSTYWCDGWWQDTGVVGFARFGSRPGGGLLVGAFAFAVSDAVSFSSWYFGVSLSYKKPS